MGQKDSPRTKLSFREKLMGTLPERSLNEEEAWLSNDDEEQDHDEMMEAEYPSFRLTKGAKQLMRHA